MNVQGLMRYNNESGNNFLFVNNSNINEIFNEKINLNSEDTFAYIYGLLNFKEYQTRYVNNLKKICHIFQL